MTTIHIRPTPREARPARLQPRRTLAHLGAAPAQISFALSAPLGHPKEGQS